MGSSTEAVVLTAVDQRRRWTMVIGGFGAAYVAGLLFATVIRSTGDWSHGLPWERSLLVAVHTPLPWVLDKLMLVLPWFGTNLSIMPAVLVLVLWLWKKHDRPDLAVWLLVVQLGSYALNPALKASFDRVRPDLFERRGWYGWTSYPSGHAIASISVLFTLCIMLRQERGSIWQFFVVGAVAVGSMYSRLYLGVHWPTDVIGGAVVGLVWLWATWKAFRGSAASRPLNPIQ